jgi:hypothetical protein
VVAKQIEGLLNILYMDQQFVLFSSTKSICHLMVQLSFSFSCLPFRPRLLFCSGFAIQSHMPIVSAMRTGPLLSKHSSANEAVFPVTLQGKEKRQGCCAKVAMWVCVCGVPNQEKGVIHSQKETKNHAFNTGTTLSFLSLCISSSLPSCQDRQKIPLPSSCWDSNTTLERSPVDTTPALGYDGTKVPQTVR